MRIVIDARKVGDYGIGTYIRGLGRAMAAMAPADDFVFLGDPDEDAKTSLDAANVSWVPNDSRKYGVSELFSVSWQARRLSADVFHAPHYVYPFMLPCAGVVTVHDCIHLRFPRQLPNKASLVYARNMLRRAVRSSQRVLTGSESTRSDLVELVGADPAKIEVIPYGCDPYFFERPSEEELDAAKQKYGLTRPFLMFAGNTKPHKNLKRLLGAFALLMKKETDIDLLLAGGEQEAAKDLVEKIGQPEWMDRVRSFGYLPKRDLRSLYTLASVFVFPSLYEGFGLPPLEAMACGTPVIAGRCSSLPEVVGHAGLLVNPRKEDAIADAIRLLLDDSILREALGERGREQAREFTWERTAMQTLEVYAEVVRQ
jgi:alpha-1,3-rhamnosyl/mannosyltransferase